ncbi:MAG: nucleotidyltransferase family protein, partial [Proteobacteria bacterium]
MAGPVVKAIVLAAGRSSRMGAEKLFLPWRGGSVLRATVSNVLGAEFNEVLVVSGGNAGQVTAALEGLPVRMVENPRFAVGMHSSIRAGVKALGACDFFAVCLGDQPTIPAPLYAQLGREVGEESLLAPAISGKRGNPVFISSALIPEILAHEDDDRGCAYLF